MDIADRIEMLKNFLKDKPKDPFLKYALAKEFEKSGDEKTAILMFEALIEEHPGYVGTYYHLGKIFERAEQFENALSIYENGILAAKKAGDQHALNELAGAKMGIED